MSTTDEQHHSGETTAADTDNIFEDQASGPINMGKKSLFLFNCCLKTVFVVELPSSPLVDIDIDSLQDILNESKQDDHSLFICC